MTRRTCNPATAAATCKTDGGVAAMMTASWRTMTVAWRLPRWPRRFAYPAAGLLLSIAMVAGLLTVEAWTTQRTNHFLDLLGAARPPARLRLPPGRDAGDDDQPGLAGRPQGGPAGAAVDDGPADRARQPAPAARAFADELNRAARYDTPLALLLVDLDRLKDINDRHGHGDGDRALQLVAEALRRTCRATDLAARYGGDEFIVLAVNTPATEARVLALRIRDSVRRLSLRAGRWSKATEPINHTVSIGAADLRAAALPTFDALHAAADRALYAAKAAGRDGVVVAPPRMRRPRRIRVGGAADVGRRHHAVQETRRPITLTSLSGGHGLPR